MRRKRKPPVLVLEATPKRVAQLAHALAFDALSVEDKQALARQAERLIFMLSKTRPG